jgi:beta-glucosidase
MRETDLLAFEIAVAEGQPGMVMCSYNKVNGDWACENSYLLDSVLKKAWGFKGFVLSDWGGTHSTAKAALAGLDNEEPGGRFFGDALKTAVTSGDVPMARLDDMVHRIVRTEFAARHCGRPAARPRGGSLRRRRTRAADRRAGSVLLKNDRGQLPLNAAAVKSIAVIGSHADSGVLSGGGSAQVDAPGAESRPLEPARVVSFVAARGHSRQGAQSQGGIQRWRRPAAAAAAGQGFRGRHRLRQPAHQRRPRRAHADAAR